MAQRVGRRHGVAVSNGTAALDVALRVLGIGPGDEVIVPALSYVATAAAVAIVGATPVFADVDPRNLGLHPDAAAAAVTTRTRAILCTDHGGSPCDYVRLQCLAGDIRVPLIVDGAQSVGANFAGRPTLALGAISTTSFHAAKSMTTGEGGMVFTDDDAVARRLRIVRSQGEDPDRKYHHVLLGHNFRMTELQAAIGLAQAGRLDTMLAARKVLAGRYATRFARLGLTPPPGVPGGRERQFSVHDPAPRARRRDGIACRRGDRDPRVLPAAALRPADFLTPAARSLPRRRTDVPDDSEPADVLRAHRDAASPRGRRRREGSLGGGRYLVPKSSLIVSARITMHIAVDTNSILPGRGRGDRELHARPHRGVAPAGLAGVETDDSDQAGERPTVPKVRRRLHGRAAAGSPRRQLGRARRVGTANVPAPQDAHVASARRRRRPLPR